MAFPQPHRLLLLLAAALPLALHAQTADLSGAESLLRPFLKDKLDAALGPRVSRIDVEIGKPDPRLALAACARIEPFLPPGATLWGDTRLGIRCAEGAAWRITVPVRIRVHGPALHLARPLAQGDAVQPGDVDIQDTELSRFPPASLADLQQIEGRIAARPLAAGQPLRVADLRQPTAVAAGDIVRINLAGAGFTISAEGKALSAAAAGQMVRVQTGLGRVLTGTARAGRVVEVAQ